MKFFVFLLLILSFESANAVMRLGTFEVPGKFLNRTKPSRPILCDLAPFQVINYELVGNDNQVIIRLFSGLSANALLDGINSEWEKQCKQVYTTTEVNKELSDLRNSFFESVSQKITAEMAVIPQNLEKSETFKAELREMIRKIVKEEIAARK